MSVEATPQRGKVGRTAGRPFRQNWQPVAVAVVDPATPEPVARVILERIKSFQRARGTGSYLFVNASLQAFVIPDDRPQAQEWVRDHFGWLVGFYRSTRGHSDKVPPLKPTVEGLSEDMVDQIAQMRAEA